MKSMLCVCVVLFGVGVVEAQYPQYPQYPQQQTTVVTSSAQASDNWRAVPQTTPMVPLPPPPAGVPGSMPTGGLPVHEWRDGLHEEWRTIHEIRPVRPYEDEHRQVVPQQTWNYPAQQWYSGQAQNYYQSPQQIQSQPTYYPQTTQCQQYYYPQPQQNRCWLFPW